MQINAELTQIEADKIAFIQQKTQQDVADVLKSAIDIYYRNLRDTPKSPLQILEETGFIGCCSVESDLSTTYKTALAEGLAQKYDHR